MGYRLKKLIGKLKNFTKNHYYIFILLLLSLFFFHSIISATKIMSNVHYINDVTFYSYNMKKSLSEGTLPLWTPYYYSGRPLYAQPEYYFLDFNFLLILLTGNIYLAMNFTVIIHLFLAGLGMYLLVNYLAENRHAAFISALIFMFNGFVHTFVVPGNIMIMEGYSIIPFILFFTIKALKENNFILNSLIAGLFTALLIFVGGVIFLPYIFILILIYSIIFLINKNISGRIMKLGFVGAIIILAGLGISAIKLLPGLEFMKLSNRGAGLDYQQYLGEPIKLSSFIFDFVTNIFAHGSGVSAAIGIIGILLLLFGLLKYKNRYVIFCISVILISVLMASESFLSKLIFNIPIFNQTRHIERAVVMFVFAASILAGFGFIALQSLIGKYKKINIKILFSIIILLIFFELFLIQKVPQSSKAIQPDDIPILEYMHHDSSQFRTVNLGLQTLIGATGYNYYAQYGISELKGGSGIWFNDYLNYLIVAQNSPAKMWGVLNNKYIVSDKKSDIEGLKLINRFKGCRDCALWESFGPYLYNNTKYLPRYYLAPNSILIVGDGQLVSQLAYSIMLQSWQPNNTVLIEGAKINDYGNDFLKKFNIIFLASGSVDQNSGERLKEYVSSGGKIVPDILQGQTSVTADGINSVLNSTAGNYFELKPSLYQNNKVVIDLNGEKGWLVASERFAYFPGWKAAISGNEIQMFKADNAVTAVYLNGEKGQLIFEYAPSSYKTGKIITIASMLILIIYLSYLVYSKKLKSQVGDSNQAGH